MVGKTDDFMPGDDAVDVGEPRMVTATNGVTCSPREKASRKKRRVKRHPFVMIAMIVTSVLLGWLFQDDLLFLLQKDNLVDLGKTEQYYGEKLEGREGLAEGYAHNSWVNVSGFATHVARSDKGKMVFKLAYVPVLVNVTDRADPFMLDWVHYSTSGRLVDLSSSKKYSGLGAWYRRNHGLDTTDFFLLMGDEKPEDYWYVPLVYLVLAIIGVMNLVGLVRWSVRNR